MAENEESSEMPPAELPMTPMIDVVFQLLIYFIVTIQPVDVLANLDVFRPSPEAKQEQPADAAEDDPDHGLPGRLHDQRPAGGCAGAGPAAVQAGVDRSEADHPDHVHGAVASREAGARSWICAQSRGWLILSVVSTN